MTEEKRATTSTARLQVLLRETLTDRHCRRWVKELEGDASRHLDQYADASSDRHARMVELIRKQLGLTTLRYQTLPDMVSAIGLPREKLCTYCWNGEALHEEG